MITTKTVICEDCGRSQRVSHSKWLKAESPKCNHCVYPLYYDEQDAKDIKPLRDQDQNLEQCCTSQKHRFITLPSKTCNRMVNLDKVNYFEPCSTETATRVYFDDGAWIRIELSPDQVMDIILTERKL